MWVLQRHSDSNNIQFGRRGKSGLVPDSCQRAFLVKQPKETPHYGREPQGRWPHHSFVMVHLNPPLRCHMDLTSGILGLSVYY